MENNKRHTERRGSFLIISVIIIVIIVIVIAGIIVALVNESEATKITLFVLVILLILLALSSCIFLEFQRKKAIRKRDTSAQMWLQQTLAEQRRTIRPNVAPIHARTSWALTTPWKLEASKMSTDTSESSLPPYYPPSNHNHN